MPEHTSTPWITSGELDDIQIHRGSDEKETYQRIAKVQGNDYDPPDYEKCKANAELIVRAVNSHDELLEACMWARAFGKNGEVHDKLIMEKLATAIKNATT